MKGWVTCFLVLFWGAEAWARHIIGGDIAINKRGNNAGEFRVTLTLLYDGVLGTTDDKAFVSVFRKKNNTRSEDFTLSRSVRQELPYVNARCVQNAAASRIIMVRYIADVTLPAGTYNDPEGYYLAWEECCRNGNIINIETPSRAGLAFYTEIPPGNVSNNSPQFITPEVKYACINKGFEADFSASDADGDALTYSLITPLIGSTDGSGTFPTKAKQGPYARANWKTGFDSTNAITATIPLQINATTGKLTLKGSQLGTFAFAIRCEESRNGVKIGEVRREFVLNVVDCVPALPSPATAGIRQASPSVTYETQPDGHVAAAGLCKGDSVVLKANDENPQWAYRWQRDGKYLNGANRPSLAVYQPGTYTLVKRFAQSCGVEDSVFSTTRVILKNALPVTLTSKRPLPLCEGDSTNLTLQVGDNAVVRWQRNGVNLPQTGNTLFNIKQAGTYSAFATDEASKCITKDSLRISLMPAPPASISLNGPPVFCSNDSVKLFTPNQTNYDYTWYLEDIPLVQAIGHEFYPVKSGSYTVVVIDTASKCATRSSDLDLTIKTAPVVTLDSIAPLCTSGLQAISLVGTPKGGTFSGNGVVGSRFVTQNLSAGNYPITYTFTNSEGCSGKATQTARIAPPPRLQLPKSLVVLRGDSVEIKTVMPQQAAVTWFPSIGLNNPRALRPVAAPDRTTTYNVTVTTAQGCVVAGEVTVTVIDLTIPNGFTPNNDGANDTWEIAGIKEYPNCTVEIFNRWGNVVFSNKGYETPWDGKWNGDFVPVGAYYYHIYLREFEYKLTGSVSVIR